MNNNPPVACIVTPQVPLMPLFPSAGSLQASIPCANPQPTCPTPFGGPGGFAVGAGPISGPQISYVPYNGGGGGNANCVII